MTCKVIEFGDWIEYRFGARPSIVTVLSLQAGTSVSSMKDTSSPLLSRGRRHSGGPCSTSASTRPGSLAGVLSASHIDHLRTSSDPITRLKSPLETFGEGGGRAGASVYNSPSPSSASSGSDLRSRQQLLRHVGSGEGERDVLTR